MQYGLQGLGWLEPLLRAVVQPQGDLALIDPATGQPHALAEFLTNFPPVFTDLAPHMGGLFGLLAGVTVYFARFGKWSSGSRLLLAMTVGSLAAFVAGPVLLSNLFGSVGGFRFTPPRGDSWANTLGALLGLVWYMRRRGLPEVATAALMSGVIGGLGLMAAQFVKLLAFMPGNPVVADEAAQKAWAHWHSMNWHSIATEQGVGLVYGLAVLVPMALLAVLRKPADETGVEDRGARAFAVFFVLNVVPYLNLVKNVGDWTKAGAVPVVLKAPLVGWIEWPALWWFNGMAVLIALATVALLRVQMRFGLAVLPATAVGRAQVIYLLLLWPMVVGNFERALVKFHENRLATEGTIFVNALLVTLLVVAHAAGPKFEGWSEGLERRRLSIRTAGAGVLLVVVLAGGFTAVVRSVYGDRHDGWGRRNLRFGEEADWRVKPILKTGQHR